MGTRAPLLVVALLCGALAAGCGSSGSTTSSSTTTSTPSTSSTSGAAAAGTSSTSSSTTSTAATSGSAVAQYVAVCKTIIQSAPTLSASVKAKVEGICDKAASGDVAGARNAAKEVCIEVVNASPVSGATKEKALAACKSA